MEVVSMIERRANRRGNLAREPEDWMLASDLDIET